MRYHHGWSGAAAALLAAAALAFPVQAEDAERPLYTDTVQLVVDNDYVDGKVNDPVSKHSKDAFIVCENPMFHLDAGPAAEQETEIVIYSNEYMEGQDKGVRNRIVKKKVAAGETVQLLPEDTYKQCFEDGSLYDFANRCYVVRVYQGAGEQSYTEYYFGLVENQMFLDMANAAIGEDEAEGRKPEGDAQPVEQGPAGRDASPDPGKDAPAGGDPRNAAELEGSGARQGR